MQFMEKDSREIRKNTQHEIHMNATYEILKKFSYQIHMNATYEFLMKPS